MSFMNLINSKIKSFGIPLDIISISIIFFIVVISALIILFKKNLSLQKKFSLIALPLSIIYAGTAVADSLQLQK